MKLDKTISFDPKMNNRFMFEFHKPFDIVPYVVKSGPRPHYIFTDKVIQYKPMHFILYDPINPSTSQGLMDGIRANEGEYPDISFNLKMLGPVGDVVEEWLIKGYLKEINFDKLDWTNVCETLIKVEIQPLEVTLAY